jgi:hypothetical protein
MNDVHPPAPRRANADAGGDLADSGTEFPSCSDGRKREPGGPFAAVPSKPGCAGESIDAILDGRIEQSVDITHGQQGQLATVLPD